MSEDVEVQRRLGATLRGKWTLKRVLGVGGMAAVYVAEHKIGRQDAIKILHPDVARSKQIRDRFEQEAHAVNRFRHPGVVEIRDIDVAEDGSPFLVMELLEGESVGSKFKREGGIESAELLRLMDELLDVLAAAHAQGIIHRDIKPDNLFVQKDGRLKVLDFGIARMREGAPKAMHTKIGSALGTVAYMAPEQTMGSKIDERADVFAVGATMFRVLAKRYVHEAATETELLVKMASNPAPPLLSVAPSVPRDIAMIVDRALCFQKAERYPDARTMQTDVREVRAGKPPPYALQCLQKQGGEAAGAAGAVGAAGVAAVGSAVGVAAVGSAAGSLSIGDDKTVLEGNAPAAPAVVVVSTNPSVPAVTLPTNPSGAEYTPLLSRQPKEGGSFWNSIKTIVLGWYERIPEKRRRPVLIAFICAVALFSILAISIGLFGSSKEKAEQEAQNGQENSGTTVPEADKATGGSEPSVDDGNAQEDSPYPTRWQGKGKGRGKKKKRR